MSYCSVTISSENLSGQTVTVTYYPTSGGTIYLGQQVFPFTYVSDYYEGIYDCYSAVYDYTYSITVGAAPLPSPSPTVTPTVTPTISLTPTLTPSPTPTLTPYLPPSQTPTVTPTATPTVTPTNIAYQAYLFAEPQDSNSSISIGQYMYDNGAINFFGFGNSGVPSTSNYENDLIIYSQYSGFISGSMGNFITPVSSLTSYIRQQSGAGVDSFGCSQNQYTFGSIEVSTSEVNPNVEYFYSIWIPLNGVGNTMTNMTVDISLGNPCDALIVNSSIPSPSLSTINVNVPAGAAIPSGIYRVLWMPTNGLQPPGLPMTNNLYFKGNFKI